MARTKMTARRRDLIMGEARGDAPGEASEAKNPVPPEGEDAGYVDDTSPYRERSHRQEFLNMLREHGIHPSPLRGNVALKVVTNPDAEELRLATDIESSLRRELGKGEMPMEDIEALEQGYQNEADVSRQTLPPESSKPTCPEGTVAVPVKGGWRKIKNQPPPPTAGGAENAASPPRASAAATGFKMPAKRPAKAPRAHPAPPPVPLLPFGYEPSVPQPQQRKRPRPQITQNLGSGPFDDYEPWPDEEGNPSLRRVQDAEQVQREQRARLDVAYEDAMRTPVSTVTAEISRNVNRGSESSNSVPREYDPERDFDPLADAPPEEIQRLKDTFYAQYLFGSDVSVNDSTVSSEGQESPPGTPRPFAGMQRGPFSLDSPGQNSPVYVYRRHGPTGTTPPGVSPLYEPSDSTATTVRIPRTPWSESSIGSAGSASSTGALMERLRRVYEQPSPPSDAESTGTRGSKRSRSSAPKRLSMSSSSRGTPSSTDISIPSISLVSRDSQPSTPGTPSVESSASDLNITPLPQGMTPAMIAETKKRRMDDLARAYDSYVRAREKMNQINAYDR